MIKVGDLVERLHDRWSDDLSKYAKGSCFVVSEVTKRWVYSSDGVRHSSHNLKVVTPDPVRAVNVLDMLENLKEPFPCDWNDALEAAQNKYKELTK